ncbi:thioredoxin family protein [Yoonia sp.]|jgi:thioredoxin-related protein|uniref:thioredoxin family protein n=1 Tax=Yoonia sp. TaxID=2212373 RepID=UPI0025F3DB81|nr:thioredoxin family protein [Yoonia sp.]
MLRQLIIAAALTLAMPAMAVTMGDDGLHKTDWMRDTFKDLREDLEEANAEGKRLLVIIEQRGCIYCTKMHEEVFPVPEIDATLRDDYFVVQINMFGDIDVTDFDGTTLPEKDMVRRWNALFTPTMMFFPQEVPEGVTATQAAVAVMPGAFGKWTTLNLLNWILEKGYLTDETFQKYHARILQEQGILE